MKDEWYQILNKYGMKSFSIHNAVCSVHFRQSDLDRDGFRVVLKKGAIPRLHLDKPKQDPEKNVLRSTVKYILLDHQANEPQQRKQNYSGRETSESMPQTAKKVVENNKSDNSSWFRYVSQTFSVCQIFNLFCFSANEIKIIDIETILGSSNST